MVSHWMSVCPSVSRTYVHPFIRFSFPDDNLSKHGISQNLVCALILWRSGLNC